ncbi:hydroxymethylbilane synthase [Thermaerobacter subterraneus]|uniref:Porphobilinogen deaminase n=1 Tax=Thermaerobacter subterraneus DSM 13965 TaxID=867903 RepID=K6P474_9FIRM|nr:hydroxymethylbilane synthase [Thermaerobacter subterraneus]EKP95855.1 hydroxymethylbilane synthase [Thermaerobacter subterraneus DSM 13965]
MTAAVLRIGTRASALARIQAQWVARQLETHHPGLRVELVPVTTLGDRNRSRPLYALSSPGAFVKELEEALLEGRIDLAVHSAKDVPTRLPEGLELAAFPQREDPADALVIPRPATGRLSVRGPGGEEPPGSEARDLLAALPPGARVGTSSLRRQAWLRARRPDLAVEPARGNLDTRLRRLDEGHWDALLLAAAGLRRLGFAGRISALVPPLELLPAPGQGALAVEIRAGDEAVRRRVQVLDRPEVSRAVRAERAFLAELGGTCRVPLGAWARVQGGRIVIDGMVAGPAGSPWLSGRGEGSLSDPEGTGRRLAEQLLAKGAAGVLAQAGVMVEAASRPAAGAGGPGGPAPRERGAGGGDGDGG